MISSAIWDKSDKFSKLYSFVIQSESSNFYMYNIIKLITLVISYWKLTIVRS